MLDTCYWENVTVNGWKIRDENQFFVAKKDEVQLAFTAEGRNGGLYFNVRCAMVNGRYYQAQRYLYKFIPTVRDLAFYLADNNFLLDYTAQRPFLDVREENKRKVDAQRIASGQAPLYS